MSANITRKAFEALFCVKRSSPEATRGEWFIVAYPEERCFAGGHVAVVIFALILLGTITLAWPGFYAWRVLALRSHDQLKDPRLMHRWGVHVKVVKPSRLLFFLIIYVRVAVLASVEVFARANDTLIVVVVVLCAAVVLLLLGVLRPFKRVTAVPAMATKELTAITMILVNSAVRTGRITNRSSIGTALISTFILALLSIVASTVDIIYGAFLSKRAKMAEKSEAGEPVEFIETSTLGADDLPPNNEGSEHSGDKSISRHDEDPIGGRDGQSLASKKEDSTSSYTSDTDSTEAQEKQGATGIWLLDDLISFVSPRSR